MRAVVVARHGGPEVLELAEVERPQVGPGKLRVALAAAGVNFRDVYERQGRPPYASPTPFVAGVEGVGEVLEVGMGVDSFRVGDRVAWAEAPGSYAEEVLVEAGRAMLVPEGVGSEHACAVTLQGLTAHYLATSAYPVAAGEVVVVHAAAGGVGLLLTQIVKLRGGTVVATTSGGEKPALAAAAGADHVTSYEDFAAVVRELTGGEGAAAVYDGVGAATFEASLAALRPRGYLVLYGAASGPVPPFDLARLATSGSLYVTRPTLRSYVASRSELDLRAGDLFSWVSQGRLEVRIGATFPLGDAARAQADLEARQTTGKLLLLPA